jgi:hypothetical protein
VKRIAVITLSPQGLAVAKRIKRGLGKADLYAHDSVPGGRGVKKFERIVALTGGSSAATTGWSTSRPAASSCVAGCVASSTPPSSARRGGAAA